MKILKSVAILLSFALAFGFFSCKKEDEDDNFSASIKFSTSGATALTTGESTGSTSRSAIRSSREGTEEEPKDFSVTLLKVADDGSIKEAQTKDGEIYMSKIKYIVKSPVTDDVFIAYETASYEIHTAELLLSTLVCIHSDGSYTNLLKSVSERATDCLWTDYETNLYFTDDGTAYYAGRDPISWRIYCYKFDPKTKTETLLYSTPALSEGEAFFIQNFMLSEDASYIYLGLSKNTTEIDRRVLVINTETKNYAEIKSEYEQFFTYDKYTDALYVGITNSSSKNVTKYNKDGTNPTKISDNDYWGLISTSKGVWGCNKTEGKTIFTNITNDSEADIEIPDTLITTESNNVQRVSEGAEIRNYMQVGDKIYLAFFWYNTAYSNFATYSETEKQSLFDNSYTVYLRCTTSHCICSIDLETGDIENVFGNSEFKDRTCLTSWSTNGEVLYYTGYNGKNPLAGKIDLSTLQHTKINSDQPLACIAAM